MECEICGKPVPENNPIRAKIEGSVMVVCKECSKLGTIQKAPPKPKYVKQNNKSKRPAATRSRNRNYSRNDEPSEELIEDFSFEVRKAREAKDWSREELGK
ncbi:MAG: TIGR00270 family protein, partial [Methanobrevibacter sp.]|nr:TIGR00270 family protein [Methanobrevibacter sp.]